MIVLESFEQDVDGQTSHVLRALVAHQGSRRKVCASVWGLRSFFLARPLRREVHSGRYKSTSYQLSWSVDSRLLHSCAPRRGPSFFSNTLLPKTYHVLVIDRLVVSRPCRAARVCKGRFCVPFSSRGASQREQLDYSTDAEDVDARRQV